MLRLTHSYTSHRTKYTQVDFITLQSPLPKHDNVAQIYSEWIPWTSWLKAQFSQSLADEHLLFKNTSITLNAKTLKLTKEWGCNGEEELLSVFRLASMYANALLPCVEISIQR